MTKDDRIKKSYDFAADLSKQIITLSTAVITLCIAFTDKVFTSTTAQANSNWLLWSLIVFVASISIGIFHLMGLTGQLGKDPELTSQPAQATHPAEAGQQQVNPAGEQNQQNETDVAQNSTDVSIYSRTNRLTSLFQVLTFVAALILALVYLGKSIPSVEDKEKISNETDVDTTQRVKILRLSEYVIVNGEVVDTLYIGVKK